MTTIVYDHDNKRIAYDSRTSTGNEINTDCGQKMIENQGVKFFFTGKTCDIKLFIDMYFGLKSDLYPECSALTVNATNDVFYSTSSDDCILCNTPLSFSFAIGSGAEYAIAALDFGKSAEDAVRYAMTRDCYTGGIVRVVDLMNSDKNIV